MDDIATTRRTLIQAGQILEHQCHGDMTRGHVSVRVPGRTEHFFMKPHSIGFGEITDDNILTIDLEGEVVAGRAKRHSEVYIHSEVFRARPDVMSVIHTHPTHSVAFSATGRPMRAISQGGAVFAGGNLPVYADTIYLIRTKEMGQGVARALGPHRAVLMRGHGVTMTGESLQQAVMLAVMLEEAARVQLLAEAAGASDAEYPPDDVARLRDTLVRPDQATVNFDYLARLAGAALRRP